MSTPPDRPLDALGLARSGTRVEREFDLAGFARLRDRLADPTGTARACAAFRLEGHWPAMELGVSADVVLTCQRCLGPLRRTLESASRLAFADEGAPELPSNYEAIGSDPRKLDLAALVEDELLLALPLIPLHDAGERCVGPGAKDESEEPAAGMRRPFAGLKDLLKH
jgi:uncharacterized protein